MCHEKVHYLIPCRVPTARKLKEHMKYMHDPENAIICDKCGKTLRTQANLKKHHELEHSDIPRPKPDPVQCEICGTWLRHLSGLKQHMSTVHEPPGEEHRCPICDKKSTNARALKRHIYHNHQCERKFRCTMCEKAFKRPQDLRVSKINCTNYINFSNPLVIFRNTLPHTRVRCSIPAPIARKLSFLTPTCTSIASDCIEPHGRRTARNLCPRI